jgi:hypothetical protein
MPQEHHHRSAAHLHPAKSSFFGLMAIFNINELAGIGMITNTSAARISPVFFINGT